MYLNILNMKLEIIYMPLNFNSCWNLNILLFFTYIQDDKVNI